MALRSMPPMCQLFQVNVITKLCRSADLSGSLPCCLSGYHTAMSELCAKYQKPVNNLQRSVRAGSVNDKFTIPLCYYRRGWFIMDFTELYAQKKMTAAQAAALVKSAKLK